MKQKIWCRIFCPLLWQKQDSGCNPRNPGEAFAARSVENAALGQLQKISGINMRTPFNYNTEILQGRRRVTVHAEEEQRYLDLINVHQSITRTRGEKFCLLSGRRLILRYTDIASLLGISVDYGKVFIVRLSFQELRKVLESAIIFLFFYPITVFGIHPIYKSSCHIIVAYGTGTI